MKSESLLNGSLTPQLSSDEKRTRIIRSLSSMFTHVKSTIRRITPDSLNGRHLLKVVYVVLEPQYQSALSTAVQAINQNNPNLAVEISGYLIEELRDAGNYEDFKRDIAQANIFIASLIFIEDLADKVVAVVEPHRDRLDAAIVFPSMPQVMRLNKLGSFSMAQLGQSQSAIAQFMRKRKVPATSCLAFSIGSVVPPITWRTSC